MRILLLHYCNFLLLLLLLHLYGCYSLLLLLLLCNILLLLELTDSAAVLLNAAATAGVVGDLLLTLEGRAGHPARTHIELKINRGAERHVRYYRGVSTCSGSGQWSRLHLSANPAGP